ncbi:MAG: polysaccharide deacetylase family protein [Micromonosporaceae bacterium]|nr:polysaccharide deacetylase family protein [Micromonosporaceae bacterium]
MDRREYLRTAALAAGLAAAGGCDAVAPTTNQPTGTAPSGTPAVGSPASGGPGTGAPSARALPPEVVTGPRDRAAVALTFHGQGDPVVIRRLLQILDSAGVQVTILAVGTWLAAQPGLVRPILDAGHELGNHTENHKAIAHMSSGQAFTEIDACARRLKSLTGSIGAWFRPSQTQHSTPTIRAQAARVGYPTCLSYDVDSLDYTDPAPSVVVKAVMDTVRPGSIISLHFGHQVTVTAMPQLLAGLHGRGLRPVTVTELVR